MDAADADAVTVAVRLPSGRTPRRTFSSDDTVNDLYAFANFKVGMQRTHTLTSGCYVWSCWQTCDPAR